MADNLVDKSNNVDDIRGLIVDLALRYGIEHPEAMADFVNECMNLLVPRLLTSMIPVYINIMTMSIPRLLFMISLFSENKINTFEQQSKVIHIFSQLINNNTNLTDAEFSNKITEAVYKYKKEGEQR